MDIVYSALEAIWHLKTCPDCRVTFSPITTCTICGKCPTNGYVLQGAVSVQHLARVVCADGRIMLWGACINCLEERGIQVDQEGRFNTSLSDRVRKESKDSFRQAMEDFKSKIRGTR